jgi:hypothetical protein
VVTEIWGGKPVLRKDQPGTVCAAAGGSELGNKNKQITSRS